MSVVILSGAGLSAESGLATFRDAGGIWEQVSLEEVATPEGFAADPARVHAFYNARRAQAAEARPNAAHAALAQLEAALGEDLTLVTQNIDDLHEKAGVTRVLHMHGSLFHARCTRCGAAHPWHGALSEATPCPACGAAGGMRPDVVWFGEIPRHMDRIEAALGRARLFVAVGTSGTVYPAAGFVEVARAAGAETLELTLEPTANPAFTRAEAGPATRTVPALVDRLIADAAPSNS